MMKTVIKQQEAINPLAKKLFEQTYEWTNQCVQCGYCLPACPTYESMGKESASPRGRINLVKMAAEGRIGIQEHLAEPIDLCLGCRACETACPVGVPYGRLLEATKEIIAESKQHLSLADQLKKSALNKLIPHSNRMKLAGNLIRLYQKTGLHQFVRKTNWLSKASEPLAQFERTLPLIEIPDKRIKQGKIYPAKGEKKGKVAFFAGCIMDAFMSRINRLTVELLREIGFEVVVPVNQACCGALHAHQGEREMAKQLAKRNILAFQATEADFYINNAGGCGAALHEYDELLAEEGEWKEAAKAFVEKSLDISQLLMEYGPLPFKQPWHGIVVYQDSCHLRNVQNVVNEPRKILQSIPGITYVELEDAAHCCASGGIYNLLHFEESMKILDLKMEKVNQTEATVVVTSNPGCQLQMNLGIQRRGHSNQMKSMHLVEILAEACGIH
ncbi:(Fe-S)-binding protein [Neobacillus sp. SM06]|uniref:(Fe-S)-binding protein n=1 Tax=Neobacillus sp. SM06 TaxID=3422492 RepID=UPI003D28EE99